MRRRHRSVCEDPWWWGREGIAWKGAWGQKKKWKVGGAITWSRDNAHATGRCVIRQPVDVLCNVPHDVPATFRATSLQRSMYRSSQRPCNVLCNAPATFYVTFLTTSLQRSMQRHCNFLCNVPHNFPSTFYATFYVTFLTTPLQRSMQRPCNVLFNVPHNVHATSLQRSM